MTILKPPWLGPVLAEDFTLLQGLIFTNSCFCHTDFALANHRTEIYMLGIIIIEKDTI